MRRKWIAALCVASLSMAMMTGCGNGSTQETAKETQTETQTPVSYTHLTLPTIA